MSVDTDAEILALRTVLRDLVALSAIPAAWIGREPAAVAAGLADTLMGLLRLDFAYVRLCVPGVAGSVDVTRGTGWTTFPGWLEGRLAGSGRLSGREIVPDVDGDGGQCRGVVIPIGIELDVRIQTGLPEPVEVAAYYVASEALTNTAKHAHASVIHVTAEVLPGVLELSICDDGAGGADSARGSGLIGLADRVDALGGTIEVVSPAGRGTTLPLEGS